MASEEGVLRLYHNNYDTFNRMKDAIVEKFKADCDMVHTIKSRIKSEDSFANKVRRKIAEQPGMDSEEIYSSVSDILGIRLITVFPIDVISVHNYIRRITHGKSKQYYMIEQIGYCWDPEIKAKLRSLKIKITEKESYYNSIHYVLSTNGEGSHKFEVQVRTLLDEAWSEVDHKLKYKNNPHAGVANHIKVYSSIVSAGLRTLTAI